MTGLELGLLWRPKIFIPRKLSVLCSKNRLVISDSENEKVKSSEALTIPNVIEIIAQIVKLSEGLVIDVIFK